MVAIVKNGLQGALAKLTYRQGKKYSTKKSATLIDSFVDYHGINMQDFVIPKEGYETFNDFFYRKLLPGKRFLCCRNSVLTFDFGLLIYRMKYIVRLTAVFCVIRILQLQNFSGSKAATLRWAIY